MTRRVIVLGSTGSIGVQALDIIARNPDRFEVAGLAAGTDAVRLREQGRRFGVPEARLALGAAQAAELVRTTSSDVVLNAISGSAGLEATVAALESGASLALANKESLVIGGDLVRALAAPGQIVPVDSEHSAIAQCLAAGSRAEVDRLVLTASGGPFRGWSRERLATVTPAQALAHPTWRMGPLVTTNSATLVNKGLEIIEAHYLFDVPYECIDAVVHPESTVHSMVQFVDGSTIAQVSPPDMRLPISLALDWPNRVPRATAPIDWSRSQQWRFEPIDESVFGAVALAREAGTRAGSWPAVFNGANERLVALFHDGRIPFPGIVEGIRATLHAWERDPRSQQPATLPGVLAADRWARTAADQAAHSISE